MRISSKFLFRRFLHLIQIQIQFKVKRIRPGSIQTRSVFQSAPPFPSVTDFSTKQISPSPAFSRKFSSTQQFSGCSCSKKFFRKRMYPELLSFWQLQNLLDHRPVFDTLLLLKSMPPLSSVQTITIISHSPSCRLSFSLRIAPSLSVPADPDVVVFILTPLL